MKSSLSIFEEFLLNDNCSAGFVLGKKSLGKRKANTSEGNSNCWEMNAKYKSITYWNHDSLPSQDDAFLRCFHWLAVAKSVSLCLIPHMVVDKSCYISQWPRVLCMLVSVSYIIVDLPLHI